MTLRSRIRLAFDILLNRYYCDWIQIAGIFDPTSESRMMLQRKRS